MGHNLFGERFLGHREPAWHGLGKTFEAPIIMSEAFTDARLNYEIKMEPLHTPDGSTVPGLKAIVRQPTSDDNQIRVFGTASPRYKIVQNRDLAAILDPLTERWPVETCGALGHGETIFASLSAGEKVLTGGEHLRLFFTVTDTKNGKEALRIIFTPVRPVCQNTLIMGINRATVSVCLSHMTHLENDLDWYASIIKRLQDAQDSTLETFERLIASPMPFAEAEVLLDKVYALPKRPKRLAILDTSPDIVTGSMADVAEATSTVWQYRYDMTLVCREDAKARLERINDEFPAIANTRWAALNAVVESEDHRPGRKVLEGSLFGIRAKTKARAFEIIAGAQ